jgi:hypothetical protein
MEWKRVSYMDETHNAEAYWICGLVVHVDEIEAARDALLEVADRAASNWSLPARPELHGYDLFQNEGDFEGIPPRARVGIYADALDAIVAAKPRVVLRGVRRKKIKYSNPHRLAWRYAIESVDELKGDAPILVVADEHAETEEALRGDIRSYIEHNTGGWKPRAIENVLPELRFLDSKTNPLLQAADLVAYLHQRRFNFPVEANPYSQRAREMLWAKISPCVAVLNIWDPPQ